MRHAHTGWDGETARLAGMQKRIRRRSDAELARRSLPGVAGQVASAVMLGLTTRILRDHTAVFVVLLAAVILPSLIRLWLALKMPPLYAGRAGAWRRAVAGCLFISGLAWGMISVVIIVTSGYQSWNTFLISISVIGLSSLGIISLTPNFAAMCWYIGAILVPNIGAHLACGGIQGSTMVALDTILGMFLVTQGIRLNQQHTHAVRANLELRTAKLRAEQASRAKDAAIAALGVSEEHYRQLFTRHPYPTWVFDMHTLRFLAVNEAALAHYGYSREEFLGLSITEIRPEEEIPRLLEDLAVRHPGFKHVGMFKHRKKDGTLIDVEIAAHDLTFAARPARLAVAVDVTERERTKRLERDRHEVVESIAQGRPLAEIMQKVLEMLDHQVSGCAISLVLLHEEGPRCIASSLPAESLPAIHTAAAHPAIDPEVDRAPWGKHTVIAEREDDPFWREVRRVARRAGFRICWSYPIVGASGRLLGAFAVCGREPLAPPEAHRQLLEVAGQIAAVAIERDRLHHRLLFQAHHDALTALPNRFLFDDRLRQALARARRNGKCVALLHIDLDRFKLINDVLGHTLGDLLLKAVAGRLQGCVRETDTLARVGGDEFTLILADLNDPADALSVAEQLRAVLLEPFQIHGNELFVTGSTGIALYPQDATEAGMLARKADSAMHRAKKSGKNRVQCFAPEMEPVRNRLELESNLHRALDRNELAVVYQPLFEAASRNLAGMEALLRWRHPRLGNVPPGQFIPIAEETGLIIPIGAWVMRQACRQLMQWQDSGARVGRVSVNVSAIQFTRPDFLDEVSAVLAETGLEPQALQLEITETVVMRDLMVSARQLAQLRELGVAIAIDDFGTGYSSLSYLQRLPVDYVKIDQSFVREISGGAARLVQAIITMAHGLGMKVTAEGIETEQQLMALQKLGCDQLQGFYLGRPAASPDPALLAPKAGGPQPIPIAS